MSRPMRDPAAIEKHFPSTLDNQRYVDQYDERVARNARRDRQPANAHTFRARSMIQFA
jgi:hypothetical protein